MPKKRLSLKKVQELSKRWTSSHLRKHIISELKYRGYTLIETTKKHRIYRLDWANGMEYGFTQITMTTRAMLWEKYHGILDMDIAEPVLDQEKTGIFYDMIELIFE